MAPVKVLLIGATGETGRSIANGLLEAGGFVCNLLSFKHYNIVV